MSITVTTDVFCEGTRNGERCVQWIFGTVGPRSAAGEARKNAKAAGWVRRNGKDLCPDCKKGAA